MKPGSTHDPVTCEIVAALQAHNVRVTGPLVTALLRTARWNYTRGEAAGLKLGMAHPEHAAHLAASLDQALAGRQA